MATGSVNPNNKIEIDYNRYDQAVQKLKPVLYLDGTTFCCLSGPDRETGIFGNGNTLEEAIQNWRSALEERFKRINGEDV